MSPYSLYPTGSVQAPVATIVWGQSDVEPWADEQEVTIDRVIGSIHLAGVTGIPIEGTDFAHVLVRIGMLVLEETETASVGADVVKLDLGENEVWEDFEWMWLKSVILPGSAQWRSPDGNLLHFNETIDVDIRNRRKVGQSDELVLFAQWISLEPSYNLTVGMVTDLRAVMMSR